LQPPAGVFGQRRNNAVARSAARYRKTRRRRGKHGDFALFSRGAAR